ncbi:MAG TPA: 2'-5' RNA ligase family protein [Puia sp.]|nr:2'-5' RNA ligase family protein [Puia sp.]
MQQAIKPVTSVLNENYKKQLSTNEYQLILNPHEELSNRIRQIRTTFAETYQAPSAQAGKPNLTLVRFTQLALMEERIVQRLRTIAMGFCPFKVELKDFGSLPTHSIFINVTSKMPIRTLVKEIRDVQRLMKLDKDHKPHFIDEPHLLIARNLLPWQYEKSWLEYSNKHFTGRFIADSMLLLRRRSNDVPLGEPHARFRGDRNWQIAERFAFQNLPVTTRQGELFA